MAASGRRELEVRYESAEAFLRDYDSNLSNGGVFIETGTGLPLREIVLVRLKTAFAPDCSVVIEGEVVHCVSPEMAALGGTAGLAVQFREPVPAIRERLAAACASAGRPSDPTPVPDARSARRTPARLRTRIDAGGGMVAGRTRDLSRSGALVGVREGSVDVGESVRIALCHPQTGATLEVDGRVVRGVESGGRLSAVAVRFEPSPGELESFDRFLEEAQSAEHVRRLGGIHGAIAELGVRSLVQMLAGAASVGTLVLRNGAEEGTIGFENGLLQVARLGPASGLKALVRMLCWTQGSFEFHARFEDADEREAPLPLEAALAEAIRHVEEGSFVDASRFPSDARLAVLREESSGKSLSKVEAALLDLARAGFTVGRVVDVIPEPDPEIYGALASLVDAELLALRS